MVMYVSKDCGSRRISEARGADLAIADDIAKNSSDNTTTVWSDPPYYLVPGTRVPILTLLKENPKENY
eukprot:scaffold3388_cov264-Pinguiococcus_pyrenoidosus.AAC.8